MRGVMSCPPSRGLLLKDSDDKDSASPRTIASTIPSREPITAT